MKVPEMPPFPRALDSPDPSALDALEADLIGAIADVETVRRRRSRRTRGAFAAIALACVGLGAAGFDDRTWVDRQLGPIASLATHVGGAVRSLEREPLGSHPTEPISVPWPGGKPATGFAYRSVSGRICFATAIPDAGTGGGGPGLNLGCQSRRIVERALSSRGVALGLMMNLEKPSFLGVAAETVREVEVVGPNGALPVRLLDPWNPSGEEGRGMRLFVAFDASAVDPLDRSDARGDPRAYRVAAKLADGRVLTASAFAN
jgi:hypothetical protein